MLILFMLISNIIYIIFAEIFDEIKIPLHNWHSDKLYYGILISM